MIYTDGKQFLLEGKNYSYVMFVNGDGFLQQLHYGGKMEKEDIGFLADTYLSTVPNHWINKDEAFDSLPSEYGFYAKGDYKEPTAIFERQDGASMSRLRYDSYRVEKDAPKIVGMPHVRSGDETLVITLKDDFSDIEVDLYYTVCDSSDVLVRNAIIRNVGKEPVMLKRAFSFRVELANGEYQLLRLAGRWGAGTYTRNCARCPWVNAHPFAARLVVASDQSFYGDIAQGLRGRERRVLRRTTRVQRFVRFNGGVEQVRRAYFAGRDQRNGLLLGASWRRKLCNAASAFDLFKCGYGRDVARDTRLSARENYQPCLCVQTPSRSDQ